jgi:hypothetical protein
VAARHLFGDATGKRAGRPRVGGFWDYTRIPGRARSHTTGRKWETFRLHGTLAGHRDTYRHRGLPAEAVSPQAAAALRPGMSVLAPPHRGTRDHTGQTRPQPGLPRTKTHGTGLSKRFRWLA